MYVLLYFPRGKLANIFLQLSILLDIPILSWNGIVFVHGPGRCYCWVKDPSWADAEDCSGATQRGRVHMYKDLTLPSDVGSLILEH